MAEAIAVVALVASITSLVDFSLKVVSRVKDCAAQAQDVPKIFHSLADRLPLLIKTLEQISARAQAGYVPSDRAKELDPLVNSILEEVTIIQQCLDLVAPAADTSRFDRIVKGLKSLAKDEKVKQSVDKIHRGIGVLVLHQTTTTVDVSDRILQELNRLNLGNSPSQQNAPSLAAQHRFGLCLGQAPLIESDAFIGREIEVQQLHQWLSWSQNAQAQRVVSITGMGGLGKTQLSLAYAREYGAQYSSVFWLDAKDITSLRQSMSALTAIIFSVSTVVAAKADEVSTHIDRVRRWLSEAWNDQWLIIFDNYDDPSLPNIPSPTGYDVRKFFPTRAHGSILITTRSSKLAFSKPLKLQKLDAMDECLDILSQRAGREMINDPSSRQLASRLGGLPLALAVAGTYLAQIDTSCAEYLDLYESTWTDLHGADAEELMEYEGRTLSSTWTISLDQIRRQDADAAELLQFWGYLNNEDIWYELIQAGADNGPPWVARLTTNKIRFNRAMSKLVDYSLVEVKDGVYRVHPCLHDWIFEHLNASLSEPLFFATIACLRKTIPDALHPLYWRTGRRLINHIDRIQHQRFATLWDTNISREETYLASHSFGDLLGNFCEYDKAEGMYLRALAGKENTLGPNHTSTLTTINKLGTLYSAQDKLDQAEKMITRALDGREKALGPYHTSTLETVSNLGNLYTAQDKFDKAEEMHSRALTGFEKELGPDHTSTLDAVGSLGYLYVHRDKLDLAEEMYSRALAGHEKVLGPDHTSTLIAVNGLGIVYHHQGKLDEAEAMYTRALASEEKIFGLYHTNTLATLVNLGLVYVGQGKLDKAEAVCMRALTGYEKLLGPDHKLTLSTVSHLGNVYRIQGKPKQAEAMFVRTLAGWEELLWPKHTPTLLAMANLGTLYCDQGKPDEAEEMYVRALPGLENVLGADHTSTIQTRNNLAALYYQQDKLEEAEKIYLRVLAVDRTAPGLKYSSTLHLAIQNFGILYRNQGMLDKAHELLTRALAMREKSLGPDHVDTLETLYNVAAVCSDRGKLLEAEVMYLQALAGIEKALGPNHTSTLCAVLHVGNLYYDQGKLAKAEENYVRALTGLERACGKDHSYPWIASISLGSLYALQDKVEDSQRLLSQALTLYPKVSARPDSLPLTTTRGYARALSRSIHIASMGSFSALTHLSNLVSCFEQRGSGDIVVAQWLAKALVKLEDDGNARLALVHSISKHSEILDMGGPRCRGCHHRLTAHMGLHVCRQCLCIDLCDNCMSTYSASTLTGLTCSDHEFCSFSEVVRQAFKPSTTPNLTKRDAWLRELKKKHGLEKDS